MKENPIKLKEINTQRALRLYAYLQSMQGLLEEEHKGIYTILLCLTVMYDGISKYELAEITKIKLKSVVRYMEYLVRKKYVIYDESLVLGRYQRADLGRGVYKITKDFERRVLGSPIDLSENVCTTFTMMMNNVGHHVGILTKANQNIPVFNVFLECLNPLIGKPVDTICRPVLKTLGYIKYRTNSKMPTMNSKAYLADWSKTNVIKGLQGSSDTVTGMSQINGRRATVCKRGHLLKTQ